MTKWMRLRGGAIEQLEKARSRLRKVETEAEQFRVNGYSEIEREKIGHVHCRGFCSHCKEI
uniref:Uncharacterized protein n=1 Tax=Solanum lycopersicum TaxID=4081 RepID=A0A3Q7J6E5_SOLLC